MLVCHCQQKQQAQLSYAGVSLSTETAGTAQLCWCVTVNRNSRHSSATPKTGRIVVTFSFVSEQNKMFLSRPSICFQSPFEDSHQATSHSVISPNHTEDTKTDQSENAVWASNRCYCETLALHVSNVFCGKNGRVLVLGPAVHMLTAGLYRVNNETAFHEDVWGSADVAPLTFRLFLPTV